MASQIFLGTPGREYIVLDNVSAPSFPTLSANTHIGYDTVSGGTASQGTNPIGRETNGSTPDFCDDQTSILNSPLSATIGFLNPS